MLRKQLKNKIFIFGLLMKQRYAAAQPTNFHFILNCSLRMGNSIEMKLLESFGGPKRIENEQIMKLLMNGWVKKKWMICDWTMKRGSKDSSNQPAHSTINLINQQHKDKKLSFVGLIENWFVGGAGLNAEEWVKWNANGMERQRKVKLFSFAGSIHNSINQSSLMALNERWNDWLELFIWVFMVSFTNVFIIDSFPFINKSNNCSFHN